MAPFVACVGGDDETDATPPGWQLVAAGYSFGFCGSPCRGDLILDGSRVTHAVRGNIDDRPIVENSGVLTPRGREVLSRAVAPLAGAQLEPVYGCPDCADGGAAYLVLQRAEGPSRHAYEYRRPPVLLQDLDALVAEVMTALEVCTSSPLVTVDAGCEPLP